MRRGLRRRDDFTDRETILADKNRMRDLKSGRPTDFRASFETIEEMRDAWDAVRDDVLPAFIEKHPGRRPFAWWLFDHGRERPLYRERLEGFCTEEQLRREQGRGDSSRFGFLHTQMWGSKGYFQEQEEDYLARHGLLGRDELRLVRAARRAENEAASAPSP